MGGLSIRDQASYTPQEQAYRYLFKAPNPATIKSGADAIVVPMETQRLPIKLYYEVTPALSLHAYLTGTAKHTEEQPVLGGAATLFSGDAFVGESTLNTTLQGEEWTVPLGADPDIRLKRHVEVKTKTKGVFSKDEISTYLIKIQVANYKRREVRVKVYDVLPISDQEQVIVKLLKTRPKAEIIRPDNGVLYWDLSLKAGARQDLTLQYQIKRPENWRIYQR